MANDPTEPTVHDRHEQLTQKCVEAIAQHPERAATLAAMIAEINSNYAALHQGDDFEFAWAACCRTVDLALELLEPIELRLDAVAVRRLLVDLIELVADGNIANQLDAVRDMQARARDLLVAGRIH